jgi:hypothetical protein
MVRIDPMRGVAALALCILLPACEHDRYGDRRDQLTFSSGDALAANRAMHIIDPWPRDARTVTHGSSGEHAEAALKKLRKRTLDGDQPAAGVPGIPLPPSPQPGAPPKI